MGVKVTGFRSTDRFDGELKRAPVDCQLAAKDALDLLLSNSAANSLRLHPLTDFGKPMIFKIDVFTNRAWQISFVLDGTVAVLKRIATHKRIDRDPRGD